MSDRIIAAAEELLAALKAEREPENQPAPAQTEFQEDIMAKPDLPEWMAFVNGRIAIKDQVANKWLHLRPWEIKRIVEAAEILRKRGEMGPALDRDEPAVRELSEWARVDKDGDLCIALAGGSANPRLYYVWRNTTPDDLDRIAEACRIRAAQLRAGK